MKFGIGQSVPRKEDPRLVTGGGAFTDDINLPGQLFLAVMRSPYAHGRITDIDISAASAAAGVMAVYTAADLAELGGLPCRAVLKDRNDEPCFIPHRPILAEDRICFVGQAVVAVVAQSRQQARDAAELVELTVADLPAVVDLREAGSPDAQVLHEAHGSNLSIHYENGDEGAFEQALAEAAHIVVVDLVNNRVVPSPLEPRACVASYDDGKFTLYNPSQGVYAQQGVLAKAIFKVPPAAVRVISGDTGGGFGVRGEVHPEACLCLFAARELKQSVKWTGDRSEMFLADSHGRDNLTTATLTLDAQGRILGLKVVTLANLGAYCTAVGPFVPTIAGGRITGTVYKIPALYHSVQCLFTNTMPVSAYRGAGRPESCYVMERLIEAAAIELGVSAVELRRKNFIAQEDLPYTNHSGVTIFSGDFSGTMDLAIARSDFDQFAQRRATARSNGRLRGIGIGYYVESSGGGPQEEAQVTLNKDGSADVVVGTFSHGQGHRTTYSQIIGETLGIDFDKINIIQGDTEYVKFGGGTGGSRSSQMGGVAVRQASHAVAAGGLDIAAQLLQAPAERVVYDAGVYRVADSAAAVSLDDVARAAFDEQFGAKALSEVIRYDRGSGYTFPNGCHVAEIEIDPDTGEIEVVAYTAVDDCGRVINPLLARGQVHGGVVQGLGQTLLEGVHYNEDGQLLTGSFMDYCIPRASQTPDIDVSFNEVLEPNNELGVKGIGEGGACGAPPALVNAVLDALQDHGVSALDMPLTPEKIWRALASRPS
ncbi:MAG: xanthine dehydrogenase family protein molybdopterin-binding subunit [Gammaproteobacteria bacterium]|nr:xanthine dehydrogenase family protein molybdopterin-binding subunit [Gammaproteobacteria bacterium]